MSGDRLEGKIRNAIRIVEEEAHCKYTMHVSCVWFLLFRCESMSPLQSQLTQVPIMKKVSAHMKKTKSDL